MPLPVRQPSSFDNNINFFLLRSILRIERVSYVPFDLSMERRYLVRPALRVYLHGLHGHVVAWTPEDFLSITISMGVPARCLASKLSRRWHVLHLCHELLIINQ